MIHSCVWRQNQTMEKSDFMPELPEVETVRRTLQKQVCGKGIKKVKVHYANMVENVEVSFFEQNLVGQEIIDVKRRGKWLLFELNDYYLLSHLRMEGKYFLREETDERLAHEHVTITFTDHTDLRYLDTRKFGRMLLVLKEYLNDCRPMKELGLEPWDVNLTPSYLKEKYQRKRLPIKTVLLDQSIITGIGNIYADEILFLSGLHPLCVCSDLQEVELRNIIDQTRVVLKQAIVDGGTTIRSYTSSEGVHGRFQQHLYVHGLDECKVCHGKIDKIKVGGRGTYYCSVCQKERQRVG